MTLLDNPRATTSDDTGWAGFTAGPWQHGNDVRDLIQRNYTPFTDDASFLTGATDRTLALWARLTDMFPGSARSASTTSTRPPRHRLPRTPPATSTSPARPLSVCKRMPRSRAPLCPSAAGAHPGRGTALPSDGRAQVESPGHSASAVRRAAARFRSAAAGTGPVPGPQPHDVLARSGRATPFFWRGIRHPSPRRPRAADRAGRDEGQFRSIPQGGLRVRGARARGRGPRPVPG